MQHKITWSKMILAIALLTRLLSAPNLSLAQDTVRLNISHKNDSTFCTSILGHQQFLLEFYVPEHLEDKVDYGHRCTNIEFRTGQGPWKSSYCKYLPSYDVNPKLYTGQGQKLGAYLDYFLDADSLFYTVHNNKVLMEARLKVCGTEDNVRKTYYSNIDSVYLDIPSPQERAAFQYFNGWMDASSRNVYLLWMEEAPNELENYYYVLRDSFPGTVLSDMARLLIWKFRFFNEFKYKTPLTPADRAYLLDTYHLLLLSKSGYIRKIARYYYRNEAIGMCKKLE